MKVIYGSLDSRKGDMNETQIREEQTESRGRRKR